MFTSIRIPAALILLAALTACRAIDGDYAPGCTAFAGDRVSLRNGQFSWNRFTDARRVDEQGRIIDPYPDFPKTGSYARIGSRIDLVDAGGDVLSSWYLHERNGGVLLLTAEQHAAWESGGQYPDCPLVRQQAD